MGSKEMCARKQALIEDIEISVSELMNVHSRENAALLAGDFARLDKLSLTLQAERARRDDLIAQYREHVINHGC